MFLIILFYYKSMQGSCLLVAGEKSYAPGPAPYRGGEWYLEKRGSQKILAGSQNLGSVFDKSEVSFFHGLFLLFLSLETFYQRVSGSDF